MGNTSKKLAAKCTLLTKDEQKYVAATFRAASKNSERIREEDLIVSGKVDAVSLEKFWGPQIDPRLAQYLTNFLFGSGQQKTPTVDFNRFAELYVFNVRGTVEERMMMTYNCLGMDYNEDVELPYQLLKEYCESIVSTYMKIVKSSATKRATTWVEKGFRANASHVQALGEAVAATVGDLETVQHHCTAAQLSKWLQSNILLKQLAELVYVNLYGINKRAGDESPTPMPADAPSLLPAADGIEAMPDYPAFIDLSHIVWINSHLPPQHQHKWRFLFSTNIHGESFSTMTGRVLDQGPSVVIIEDSSGYIFGGFATASWAFGPNFTGTDDAFLFTCVPKMRVYPATNYNHHYQYLNHHTKTLPNGLLMGGQFNFGGIWLSAEPFGEGASAESCSTFRGYRRLSKDATFHLRSLEVWAVGDKPVVDKDGNPAVSRASSVLDARQSERHLLELIGKRPLSDGLREAPEGISFGYRTCCMTKDERDVSILDTNPEAKAILDMAGRTRHSEGLREEPPL